VLNVQRRIPVLDQVALFVEPGAFSGWRGVRRHMSSTGTLSVIKPVVVRDAVFQSIRLPDMEREVTPVRQLLDKHVIAILVFDRPIEIKEPIFVGFPGFVGPIDSTHVGSLSEVHSSPVI